MTVQTALSMHIKQRRRLRRPHHRTRHRARPPTFFSTHSRASIKPRSVARNRHSPGDRSPSTCLLPSSPRTIRRSAGTSRVTLCFGLLIGVIRPRTGSLCQYFNPSHNRLDATFDCVTGSTPSFSSFITGFPRSKWGCGGTIPPRTTFEINPAFCKARHRLRCILVLGIEVNPRRALVALLR